MLHVPAGKGEGIWEVKECSLKCNPAQTQQAVFKEGKTCLLLQNKYNAKRDFPTCSPILDFFLHCRRQVRMNIKWEWIFVSMWYGKKSWFNLNIIPVPCQWSISSTGTGFSCMEFLSASWYSINPPILSSAHQQGSSWRLLHVPRDGLSKYTLSKTRWTSHSAFYCFSDLKLDIILTCLTVRIC